MACKRLLNSWAMPPASEPTASSFCDCRNWSSFLRSSAVRWSTSRWMRSVRVVADHVYPAEQPVTNNPIAKMVHDRQLSRAEKKYGAGVHTSDHRRPPNSNVAV